MSNLPDNFSLSSFEGRYPPENEQIDKERQYLNDLRETLAVLECFEVWTDEQEREAVLLEDQIATQLARIEDMEGA